MLTEKYCGDLREPSSRHGREENVAPMAWNCHAIEQTQLRRQTWGARNLISTQVQPTVVQPTFVQPTVVQGVVQGAVVQGAVVQGEIQREY